MKIKFILPVLFFIFVMSQDRSYLYTNGGPDDTGGYVIAANDTLNFSMSLRLSTYAFSGIEYFGFYVDLLSESGNLTVTLYSGSATMPGTPLATSSYSFARDDNPDRTMMVIIHPENCLEIEASTYYWFSLQAADPETQVLWQYAQNSNMPYCTSNDNGDTWSDLNIGTPGAAYVWGSRLYQSSFDGDLNLDYAIDVTDIVMLVAFILGQEEFTPEQMNLEIGRAHV